MRKIKKEKEERKKYKSGNGIGVRIVAGVLAFLMILSIAASAISYFVI